MCFVSSFDALQYQHAACRATLDASSLLLHFSLLQSQR